MTGAKFEYDESGTFYYFLLSFELLCVIPCTYYFYPRSPSRHEELRDKTVCHCYGCCSKKARLNAKEPLRKAKDRFIKFLLFVGWLSLFLTAYKVTKLNHNYVAYDPFEILEITPESSMTEIKKAYRKLSLKYHPDKESGDERMFMRIAKAYAALTNEESRNNWELYGNPDGPGPTTFGIALPSVIIQKENTFFVLGLYALVFMVALPVGVTLWWYRSIRFSDEILLDTTQLFYYFIFKSPHMIFKRVIMIVAASMEFERSHNSDIFERETDNYEVPKLIKELSGLGEKNKERPLCFSYSIKARALIYAHLLRLNLSSCLESDKLVIVSLCPRLLVEFVSCASQLTMLALAGRISRMPNLTTLENAMKLCACIVQAVYENKSPLLQLPHVNEDILRHFTSRKRSIRSIHQLAFMENGERRALLRTLTDDEYQDVVNVISRFPIIELEVRSEVLDDDEDSFNITAGAIVTVTVNLIRKNLSDVIKEKKSDCDSAVGGEEENTHTESSIANGDVSTKKKVWEKPSKKKRGKKGQPKKKLIVGSVKNSTSRKTGSSIECILPNGVPESDKGDAKKRDSDSESEDSSLSAEASPEENNTKDKNDLDDDDADEWAKFQEKVVRKKKEKVSKSNESPHIVHCPYFPDIKHEAYWVYLADKHKHTLVTNPYFVTNLVFKEEVEMKFSAPSKPGLYSYSVIVRSDSYIDFDVIKTIQLDVKEAKQVDITKVQWDVSEEEEEKDDEESAVEDSDLASDEVDDA